MGILSNFFFGDDDRRNRAMGILGQAQGPNTSPQGPIQPTPGTGLLGGQTNRLNAATELYAIPGNAFDPVAKNILDQRSIAARGQNEFIPSSIQEYEYIKKLSEPDRQLYFKNKRAQKFLDVSTGYQNQNTGEFIDKNIEQAQVEKAVGTQAGKDLTGYQENMNTIDQQLGFIGETQSMLSQLSGLTDYGTTGFAAYLNSVPTSDQQAWDNIKTTIQSRLGLGKLAELKAGSSSGASGFGALSERELDLLVSNMGKLDQTSNPAEIKRIISSITKQLDGASDRMRRKRGQAQDFYQRNKQRMPESMQPAVIPESNVIDWNNM